MKHAHKTLLSLVAVWLPFCIFAQNFSLPDWETPSISPLEAQILSDIKTVHERSVIPTLITASSECTNFDSTGLIITSYSNSWYGYDEENRLIGLQSIQLALGSSNPVSERTRITYDSNGKRTMLEHERLNNNNEWKIYERTIYYYDNTGYLIESLFQNFTAGYPTRITYTNNATGYFTKALSEYHISGVWKTNRIQTVQRDSANRIIDDLNEAFFLSTGQLYFMRIGFVHG